MTLIVLGIFALYYLLLVLLMIGWGRRAPGAGAGRSDVSLTVVIPVRNEAQSVINLLDDLERQTNPPLEVILVDDHSTDNTVQVVEEWLRPDRTLPIRLIQLGNGVYGKKQGIATAVSQARGDVIVTTDGDCRVGNGWLQSVSSWFADENIQLLAGAVRLEPATFFGELQQLEQVALTGTTAAFISLGVPVMCNGANLAYRRNVFNELDGYKGNEHVASGDDEFLLKKIAVRYPKGVVFNSDPGSVVATTPAGTAEALLHQRVRWAGKWRLQKFDFSSLIAILIFVFHFTLLWLPVLAMQWVVSMGTFSLLILIKIVLELIWLKRVSAWLSVPLNIHAFAALQFLYTPYVVFFGLLSGMVKANWKGRKV